MKRREKALAEFNRLKANNLEAINTEGKDLAGRKTELEKKAAEAKQAIEKTEIDLKALEEKEVALKAEKDTILQGEQPVESTPEYYQLNTKHRDLQDEIRKLEADSSLAVAKIQKEIDTLLEDIRALEQAAARLEARKSGRNALKNSKPKNVNWLQSLRNWSVRYISPRNSFGLRSDSWKTKSTASSSLHASNSLTRW